MLLISLRVIFTDTDTHAIVELVFVAIGLSLNNKYNLL